MTTQARLHRGELKVFPMSFVRIAIWMFTMWCLTMTCIGQHLEGEMVVKSGLFANGTRVVLYGETLRPGQAAGREEEAGGGGKEHREVAISCADALRPAFPLIDKFINK